MNVDCGVLTMLRHDMLFVVLCVALLIFGDRFAKKVHRGGGGLFRAVQYRMLTDVGASKCAMLAHSVKLRTGRACMWLLQRNFLSFSP